MISRRGLLKGILAFGVAPAIISVDNLMKIAVPKPNIITIHASELYSYRVDEFSRRILRPAMEKLALEIDKQVMSEVFHAQFKRIAQNGGGLIN